MLAQLQMSRRACVQFVTALLLWLMLASFATAYFGFIGRIGGVGTDPGQFRAAGGLASDAQGNAYVVDALGQQVNKYSSTAQFLLRWGNASDTPSQADGQFSGPARIAVNLTSGDVYVTDRGNNRVQRFSPTGQFLGKWGRNGGDGTAGTGNGEFTAPVGIAVDRAGNVYVSDGSPPADPRVQVFAANGAYLATWAQLPYFTALAVDASGIVYGAGEPQLWKLSNGGQVLARWGSGQRSAAPGQFGRGTVGVAVDPSTGAIWASDPGNQRIQQFNGTGTVTAICRRALVSRLTPTDIAAAPNHDILTGDQYVVGRLGETTQPAPACDDLPPVLSRLNIAPRTVHPASTSRPGHGGATIRYTVSKTSKVELAIYQRSQGRRLNGRCRPAGQVRHGRRCTRLSLRQRITVRARPGRNATRFTGRSGRRTLPAGGYEAHLLAVDSAGNRSSVVVTRFTLVRS